MSAIKVPNANEKKVLLQMENGEEVDLKEILTESTLFQMKEMGFPIDETGKFKMKDLPSEVKSEVQLKEEKMDIAANFIKHTILPAKFHQQYGVKQINTDSGSMGSLVPTELANEIIMKKAKFNALRERAFQFQLAGKFDLPVEGDDVTGYWVGEVDDDDANLVTASEPTTSKKTLDDHYVAALVKTSWKLLNTSSFNIVNYIATIAGRKLAETEEAAFIGGNGTGKPKGIRTESITSVAQEGAGLVYDDLVNLWFSLPAQYRANAVFITSPLGAKLITALKDQQLRPIFMPGQPLDELFRRPIVESTDIPENLTGAHTEIYFGDPSYYWIKDGTAMEMATQDIIERLQTKILLYQAVDGKLTLPDAFVKLTGVIGDDES